MGLSNWILLKVIEDVRGRVLGATNGTSTKHVRLPNADAGVDVEPELPQNSPQVSPEVVEDVPVAAEGHDEEPDAK